MKKLLISSYVIVCLAVLTFGQTSTRTTVRADFNGDGKSDIAVWRPSNGVWYILNQAGGYSAAQWGMAGDRLVPGDYDGDSKTDYAVVRSDPFNPYAVMNLNWYVLQSTDNLFTSTKWGRYGVFGGEASLPGDYDGDGKTDLSVFSYDDTGRGKSDFVSRQSSNGEHLRRQWGFTGDSKIAADFDGDRKTDYVVFRDAQNYRPDFDLTPLPTWYILQSSNGAVKIVHFGQAKDKLVAADYDGDGKDDVAVWRPSNGYWYWLNSRDGSFRAVQFGQDGDKPVPADYDGDGRTDIGVFRPSNGTWYLLKSTEGFSAVQFGFGDDTPIPNVFVKESR